MEVVINPQGEIDHFLFFGNDFRTAAEASNEVANVTVVLLDGKSQVFASEELILRDKPMKTLPVVGQERFAFDTDFVEKLPTGFVITATKHPGNGAASDRVIRSPNPELASLFLRKCHSSSSIMMKVWPVMAGSGI
jgi:hypothetical protein